MTKADQQPPTLDALREEIDAIDGALHALLMERGEIIDRLIAVKARQGGGSAFRPSREAEMMRRLVARHAGILPLDTVEGIWRIIISTFTYVQAPYTVHADVTRGDARTRDSCRFHFGFTVPLATHQGARAVIAAVAAAKGDLGLVRVDDRSGPWWHDLEAPDAPKIIARLPFVERADHAAGLPLYVVAKPLPDAASGEVALHAARFDDGRDLVVTDRTGRSGEAIARDLGAVSVVGIGSHASRFEIDADNGHVNNGHVTCEPPA